MPEPTAAPTLETLLVRIEAQQRLLEDQARQIEQLRREIVTEFLWGRCQNKDGPQGFAAQTQIGSTFVLGSCNGARWR